MTSVRALRREDLEAVLPLVAGYQRFYGAEPDDERNRAFFRRFIAPSDQGLLLGAWEGDELIGFATIYWTHSSTRAADVALMNDLFVVPERRGTGAGRLLIEASAAAARDRGCVHLEWFTATGNEVAQRLYERMGAVRSAWFAYELLL
ncbi:MAG: GNAT family N-acetyltransferase [Actinomycetota bacterium]|nr:GNAT family N-acetyltransferase [Actinomycetota bacterium]